MKIFAVSLAALAGFGLAITVKQPSDTPTVVSAINNIAAVDASAAPLTFREPTKRDDQAPPAEPSFGPPPEIDLKVTLGHVRSNVGIMSADDLFNAVSAALHALCNEKSCMIRKSVSFQVPFRSPKNIIEMGYLNIWVESSRYAFITERNAMIAMVAMYAKISIEDRKNCYTLILGANKKPTQFCNVGNQVIINANNEYGLLHVHFDSNAPVVGVFDCVAIEKRTSESIQGFVKDLGRAYSYPVKSTTTCIDRRVHGPGEVYQYESTIFEIDEPAKQLFTRSVEDEPEDEPQEAVNTTLSSIQGAAIIAATIGTTKRNFGYTANGAAAYDEMYKVLLLICGSKSCSRTKDSSYDLRIEFESGPKRLSHKDMTIKVEKSYYPNKQVRNLLIGMVAAIIQASVEDAKNCHKIDYYPFASTKQKTTTHCNIPDYIHVEATKAWYMDIRFEFTPTNAIYDCPAILEVVNRKFGELTNEFSQILDSEVTTDVRCIW